MDTNGWMDVSTMLFLSAGHFTRAALKKKIMGNNVSGFGGFKYHPVHHNDSLFTVNWPLKVLDGRAKKQRQP